MKREKIIKKAQSTRQNTVCAQTHFEMMAIKNIYASIWDRYLCASLSLRIYYYLKAIKKADGNDQKLKRRE